MDVLLVNMPIASVVRPSIALGVLKTILTSAGISTTTHYANLEYASYLGLSDYASLEKSNVVDLLGEWLFGEIAFDDSLGNRYLDHLRTLDSGLAIGTEARLRRLRATSTRFVQALAEKVLAMRPRIVGCTSMFEQNAASLSLLRLVREMEPSIVTMMGGANCEGSMGAALHENFPWVDFVVSGEADDLIAPLCHSILQSKYAITLERLPFGVLGPAHRLKRPRATDPSGSHPRAIVPVLKSVVPDYDDYFSKLEELDLKDTLEPSLPMESSRGCWWGAKHHCTFCGLNGSAMAFRSKRPDDVLVELNTMVSRYGVRRIQAVDNILDTRYLTELLPRLHEAAEGLSVFYEVKANLKRNHIKLFASTGITMIQPGIESLNSNVLSLMRKGCAAWQNILLLKWCKQYGISVVWNLIYDFPGESDEWYADMARIIPALRHLQPGAPSRLRYDRFSPYFDDQPRWGLALRPNDSYASIYPLGTAALQQLAYFFVDDSDHSTVKADRSGLQSVLVELDVWQKASVPRINDGGDRTPPARLVVLRDEFGEGTVVDTRGFTTNLVTALSIVDLAILDFGDNAPRLDSLVKFASERFEMNACDIKVIIDRLITLRFLIEVDDRVVSLVLDAPVSQPLGLGEKKATGRVLVFRDIRRRVEEDAHA